MAASMHVMANESLTIGNDTNVEVEYTVADQHGCPATELVIANMTPPDAVPANDILLGITVDRGVNDDGDTPIVLWPRSSVTLHGKFTKVKVAPSSGTVEFWIQASYN